MNLSHNTFQVSWRPLLYFVMSCVGWTFMLTAIQKINPLHLIIRDESVIYHSPLSSKTFPMNLPYKAEIALNKKEDLKQIHNQVLETYLPKAYPLLKKVAPSSTFGVRLDPFSHQLGNHPGIDLPAIKGTPILASAAGKVVAAGYDAGYGNQVTIDHGNGYVTKYGHADQLLVKVGQLITQSQTIALVGSTGKSTGPHLHYEILKNDQFVNPTLWLGASGGFDQNTSFEKVESVSLHNFPRAKKILGKTNQKRDFYQTGDLVAVVKIRSGNLSQ